MYAKCLVLRVCQVSVLSVCQVPQGKCRKGKCLIVMARTLCKMPCLEPCVNCHIRMRAYPNESISEWEPIREPILYLVYAYTHMSMHILICRCIYSYVDRDGSKQASNQGLTAKNRQSSTHSKIETIKRSHPHSIGSNQDIFSDTNLWYQPFQVQHPRIKRLSPWHQRIKKGVWQESREPVCDQDSLFEIKIGRLRSRPR